MSLDSSGFVYVRATDVARAGNIEPDNVMFEPWVMESGVMEQLMVLEVFRYFTFLK